jgi:hypothetical protein
VIARRLPGTLLGLVLLIAGVLLALYGYGGDSGGTGDTYVTIARHETDAGLAGAVALPTAFFAILCSTMFLYRGRTFRDR